MTQAISHRPTIAVTRHAISAGHYFAATAGFEILQAGGNAIDAGCAAGIALGVLQSDLVDVAGVAPIMIYLADKQEVVTIAGLGPLAKALDPQLFHARAWRQDPERRAANRGAGRPRRLDHGAAALWHDELWRGRGSGDPAGAGRVSDVSADGRQPQAARSGSPRLAVDGSHLSAEWAAAGSRRSLPANRPRRIVAIHGRRGARRRPPLPMGAAARRVSKRPATPFIAATSLARSSPS